jgi:hypothetical protein
MGAWHALRAHLRSSRLGDGRFEAVFTEEAAPELARLAEAERACCAWASWSVDGTRLVVTGPADGVAALADALLGASARG